MARSLARYLGGLLVGLAALLLSGCARHTVGRGRLAIFGIMAASGGQAGPGDWFVRVHPSGLVSFPTTVAGSVGAFALNTALAPGRYVFSLKNGNATFRSVVTIRPTAAWYQVVKLKCGAGLGAAPAAESRISSGTLVFGLLTRTDGSTPLAGAGLSAVRLHSSRPFRSSNTLATSNRLGTFVLGARLRAGTYAIVAQRGISSRRPQSSGCLVARTVVVIKRSAGPWVVVRLREPSGSVAGRVLDSSGRPVPGLGLGFLGHGKDVVYGAETDRQGRYSVRDVLPGTYIVLMRTSERVVTVGKGRVRRNFRLP